MGNAMVMPTSYQSNLYGKPRKQAQPGYVSAMGGPKSPMMAEPASQRNSGGTDLMQQLQSMWDMGRIANGPGEKTIDNNIISYMQQLGLIGADQKMKTADINRDAGYSRERLGLSREGLGLQRGALQREDVLDPRLHQLSLEELKQQGERNLYGADVSNRSLSSQATVAGNLQSQGARQGFTDIAKQLEFGQRDVLRGTQRENLGFEERRAGRDDQRKQLDLAAKGLDIDGRELESRTTSALQQLGLSSALSTQDVIRAINDANAGRYNPIQALLGTIYQASGVRPVASKGRK